MKVCSRHSRWKMVQDRTDLNSFLFIDRDGFPIYVGDTISYQRRSGPITVEVIGIDLRFEKYHDGSVWMLKSLVVKANEPNAMNPRYHLYQSHHVLNCSVVKVTLDEIINEKDQKTDEAFSLGL